jgi:hypothetical protein
MKGKDRFIKEHLAKALAWRMSEAGNSPAPKALDAGPSPHS